MATTVGPKITEDANLKAKELITIPEMIDRRSLQSFPLIAVPPPDPVNTQVLDTA